MSDIWVRVAIMLAIWLGIVIVVVECFNRGGRR